MVLHTYKLTRLVAIASTLWEQTDTVIDVLKEQ